MIWRNSELLSLVIEWSEQKSSIFSEPCEDQLLQNVRSRHTMEAGGWITNGAPHQESNFAAGCGGFKTFWAYAHGGPVGSVQATFRGSGNGILNFGNCYTDGVTKVYLNGQIIGSAGPNQNSQVNFNYKGGDILRITEEHVGILKINSLQLNCQG